LKTNFFEYVNDRRIRDAIPRLIEGEDPIMSVAYDVGFNSRSAFYKAFRSTTGQTPTEFRLTTAGRSHSAPVRERSPSSGLDPL
jgi:AraC-like DNA-binding protein